jgi:hypothetical protein
VRPAQPLLPELHPDWLGRATRGLSTLALLALQRVFWHLRAAEGRHDGWTARLGVRYSGSLFRWDGSRARARVKNVSRAVKTLERRGLVERRREEARTTQYLKLTPAGRLVAERMAAAVFGEHWPELDAAAAVYRGLVPETVGGETVWSPPRRDTRRAGACVVCGRPFKTYWPNKVTCGAACAREKNRRYAAAKRARRRAAELAGAACRGEGGR